MTRRKKLRALSESLARYRDRIAVNGERVRMANLVLANGGDLRYDARRFNSNAFSVENVPPKTFLTKGHFKMAKNQARRLSPKIIEADRTAYAAAQSIAGYTSANPAFHMTNITAARDAMDAAQTAEAQAIAAAATARDMATQREWEYHNLVLGMKTNVSGQFGSDSVELQAVGLKRKSEYKTRQPKAKPTP